MAWFLHCFPEKIAVPTMQWKHHMPLEKTNVRTTCSSENPGNWRLPDFPGFSKKTPLPLKSFKKNSCVVCCIYPRTALIQAEILAPLMKSINSMTAWCTCHEDSKNSGISIHHTYKVLTFFLTHTHTEFRSRAMGEKSPFFMQFSQVIMLW